ncbi:MAG: pesticidal protein Cry7Aa [Gammaproteobacteria bacterium]|jgi:predicted GH43/DUF377 family glycosyl hydrolase
MAMNLNIDTYASNLTCTSYKPQINNLNIVLAKSNLPFENHSVLNPACIQHENITHMFYRAVRKTNMQSTIGYCQLKNNIIIKKSNRPILIPEHKYESHGIEDPRIVKINDTYYLTYTVFDGKTALVGYASSTKLPHFNKHGLLFPKILFRETKNIFAQTVTGKAFLKFHKNYLNRYLLANDPIWMKNIVLFPKKINGKYALIYRVLPGMQISYFDDFEQLTKDYWLEQFSHLDDHKLFYPYFNFEAHHVAPGCPPIETAKGWLLIYHAVDNSAPKQKYYACAALLDLDNPQKVIARLKYPLFSPENEWEKTGVVDNVVFPSGAVIQQEKLHIYYGAADNVIAAKSIDLAELLYSLERSKLLTIK